MSTAPESSALEPLVFPVGHYMGAFYPSEGAPVKHHIVRVGWDTPKLPDEAHLDIWALAHGLPSRIDTVRWTRQAIVGAADEAGMANATAILDSLAEKGLIAEVTPGTQQAKDFAASYRLQSLLIGLGNSPDDPVLDGIGLAGLPAIVKVRPRVFEIWQWAHLWPDLWAACGGLASVAGQAEDASPEDGDPAVFLDFTLEAIRVLIANNAVYLDVAKSPPAGTGSAR